MPRWIRITGSVLVGVLVLLVIAISMTIGWRPFIGPRARTADLNRLPKGWKEAAIWSTE